MENTTKNTKDIPTPALQDKNLPRGSSLSSNSIRNNNDHRNSKEVNICMKCQGTLDNDKDLQIRSLYESIEIHKELVEQSQREREEALEQHDEARQALQQHQQQLQQLQLESQHLNHDLQVTKQAYQRMETNFYTHMCAIRATDDDLSTIQPELCHIFSQVNNFCMGLRSKMDEVAGTSFVLAQWPEKEDWIRQQWMNKETTTTTDNDIEQEKKKMKKETTSLEPAIITLFIEKYIASLLIDKILLEPIQLGVSINQAFAQLDTWMRSRQKKEWSTRLRQQLCAMVVKMKDDEEKLAMEKAQTDLVQTVLATLAPIYPNQDHPMEKKLMGLVQRTCKLAAAIKGQDVDIHPMILQESKSVFDPHLMKAVNKGNPDGTIYLVITPPFIAEQDASSTVVVDDDDDQHHHGFLVQGKVLCL
ncbi:uncharacterized protein BX664DRAFT_332165 [Halteromyces radiatus]|uniref:uncharacterized protein n=1 Tax=Halteromyces radiatus TaxID=101107 RepID=UPI00222046F0|nr:uncharacterized protein BX664DRAFT_332165 [Halteromyces radiatus]KAI8089101.1 hypothetical protein BX664DRAFT_332165 [Halteromyces radiatus]